MSAALTVVPEAALAAQPASLGFEPATLDDAWRLAKLVVASGLAPKAVRTPEAAIVMILTGRELGLTAMQSIRSIHVVEGKPLLSADLMLALCLRLPTCEMFSCIETTDAVASFTAKRRGQPETRLSFSIEQARNAGLSGKDNWKKYPAAMLRARAIAALARLVFPDAFVGVYEEDEIPRQQSTHVETEARTVPEPRPSPAPDSAPHVASVCEQLADAMLLASTLADLDAVARRVAGAGVSAAERAELAAEYRNAKARLSATTEPAAREPAMREPGEEGLRGHAQRQQARPGCGLPGLACPAVRLRASLARRDEGHGVSRRDAPHRGRERRGESRRCPDVALRHVHGAGCKR